MTQHNEASPPNEASPRPPRIMGILNVTPDSFSDGGHFLDPDKALMHGLNMVEEGADILDVGGESTRPGSLSVPASEQLRRVIEVIRRLRERLPPEMPMSIDTTSSVVARASLEAGANWINDVSAGMEDPRMLPLAAELGATVVLMHRQGRPETMQKDPRYVDVARDVKEHLLARVDAALGCGVDASRIVLDPGIGFGKRVEHNLVLLAGLEDLVSLGFPVLLGTSRKRFLGALCSGLPPTELAPATCATTAIGVMAGVEVFRVHDVAANRQAADLAWATRRARRIRSGAGDAGMGHDG